MKALALAAALLSATGFAADVMPGAADRAKEHDEAPPPQTTVTGERLLSEEALVGENQQPVWTTERRFPNTRIYVLPGGDAELEYWLATKHPLHDFGASRYRSDFEAEFGLGHRLQLDLYLETEAFGGGPMILAREKVELRYALAPWGVLPGNPTLYGELVRDASGIPSFEGKLLFGGQLRRGLHWGANLVWERELSGPAGTNEYAFTWGISKTLSDNRFSLGAELNLEATDVRAARLHFASVEALAGPSLSWHPTPRAHVLLVALVGCEWEREGEAFDGTLLLEPTLIFGWKL